MRPYNPCHIRHFVTKSTAKVTHVTEVTGDTYKTQKKREIRLLDIESSPFSYPRSFANTEAGGC